jgi:hypothetical protein
MSSSGASHSSGKMTMSASGSSSIPASGMTGMPFAAAKGFPRGRYDPRSDQIPCRILSDQLPP